MILAYFTLSKANELIHEYINMTKWSVDHTMLISAFELANNQETPDMCWLVIKELLSGSRSSLKD